MRVRQPQVQTTSHRVPGSPDGFTSPAARVRRWCRVQNHVAAGPTLAAPWVRMADKRGVDLQSSGLHRPLIRPLDHLTDRFRTSDAPAYPLFIACPGRIAAGAHFGAT